jgi:mannose-6-phosphate isomerase-like protein (cupin superfamily)
MRRVVTGHKDGKSVVISDGIPPSSVTLESFSGVEITEIWATEDIPTIPVKEGDPTVGMPSHFPGPRGTRFRVIRTPPTKEPAEAPEKVDKAAARQELLEKSPGLAEVMEPESPGMHTTDSVDYIIVLSGEIYLELDDGVEVKLKQGDCVVQNGTRHAWKNRGPEDCITAGVLIGAKRS